MTAPLRFAAIGIDHRHIYGMAANLIAAGADFAGWWTQGHPNTEDGFVARFPDVPRAASAEDLLSDPTIGLIVLSGIPRDRAAWAVQAMAAGKDVLSDKPGCTTSAQLKTIRASVARTGRIWSVNFSERFEVPAATRAAELVAEGAIGRVIQTLGIGPHRLNRATRPDWFFDRAAYGGILTDIASHQIDQFLFFTGSTSAEVTLAQVANYANPDDPGLQDFGEIALKGDRGHGYIRVDWYTPDALPTWGDGRLTILGTEGYIELRKYVDIGHAGTDHLILVNGTRCERIDASDAGLPFFARLINDIRDRTETAMTQAHVFQVCDLALRAQSMAEGLGE
ncbi:Gfo/Idh/MocA family oxidoreductase [Octadecabacter sp. SW4]|uniref:Gfo/Idh/MocA family protein n=1 Tax=Octadecabacter sp. SW4 TaxID=2602067 RepID=UPI0011C1E2F0|nr:Gfo/Idh/MocA family oxidoreductase [Octadecabacter sp. SW4]QEE34792.1 Gfo/Idh/MocA family oxidoreductase [Octadecabacter sp. SW4]